LLAYRLSGVYPATIRSTATDKGIQDMENSTLIYTISNHIRLHLTNPITASEVGGEPEIVILHGIHVAYRRVSLYIFRCQVYAMLVG